MIMNNVHRVYAELSFGPTVNVHVHVHVHVANVVCKIL